MRKKTTKRGRDLYMHACTDTETDKRTRADTDACRHNTLEPDGEIRGRHRLIYLPCCTKPIQVPHAVRRPQHPIAVGRCVCCNLGARQPLMNDGRLIKLGSKVIPYFFPANDVTPLRPCNAVCFLHKVPFKVTGVCEAETSKL